MKGLTADGSTRSWRETRRKVLASKGARCSVCGSTKDLSVGHKTPRRKGGSDKPRNLTVLCRRHQDAGRPKGT